MKPKYTLKQLSLNSDNPDSKYYDFTEILYNYKSIKEFPISNKSGLEKYLPLLPINSFHFDVSKIGNTPLLHAEKFGKVMGLGNLYIKREDANPTGSFKDRESAVVVSAAIELGHHVIYIVSSGYAALSIAKYASEAGLNCTCYVPDKTLHTFKNQIINYKVRLVSVSGYYEDVYRIVVDTQPLGWNVTSGQNPYRIEGAKTITYEIIEQLGKVPDIVVVPSGNGGCIAAMWKGFIELKKFGKIQKLPQMIAAQIAGAAPLKSAFVDKLPFALIKSIPDSIADNIAAKESYNAPTALKALRESGGMVIDVSDFEIIHAMKQLNETEAILTDPSAAAGLAALKKIKCRKDDLLVVVNTGKAANLDISLKHLLTKDK